MPGATDRYFERDITEPFVLDGTGAISVPTGPGLGIDVDIEAVAAYTVAQLTLRWASPTLPADGAAGAAWQEKTRRGSSR